MRIEEIDPNFKPQNGFERDDMLFCGMEDPRFSVHGLMREEGRYYRMPLSTAAAISENVGWLNGNTAGGRIRFCCDSPYIAVAVKWHGVTRVNWFAFTGSAGMDLYVREDGNEIYRGTLIPYDNNNDVNYTAIVDFADSTMREITINLPTYSGVDKLLIGFREGTRFEPVRPYTYTVPVAFYGSSITQGGCASRPGNTYEAILSRALDCEYLNLGFSGSALGEDAMAAYLAGLTMSAFVYDYDYNAPSVEHLRNTHERLFQTVRAAQPTLPVLFLTRPKAHLLPEEEERLAVVRRTYENARQAGDRYVWMIPGPDLVAGPMAEVALVDNCHPDDAGFLSMAMAIEPVLRTMLEQRQN